MSRDERDGNTYTTPTPSTDGGSPDPDGDGDEEDEDEDEDEEETRSILVELPAWQFRKLRRSKEKHGRTWKGLLIDGRRYNECKNNDDE